jgi:hypothetical protein
MINKFHFNLSSVLAILDGLNFKCERFKREHDVSAVRVHWNANDIQTNLVSKHKIPIVMALCASLSIENLIKCPMYTIGDGTIDVGGVFRDLTHEIAMSMASTPYFEGSTSAILPVRQQNAPPNYNRFFFGLGKYLLLVLLHEGSCPVLHSSVVRFLLELPDPIQYSVTDIADLKDDFLNSLYSLRIEDFPQSMLDNAKTQLNMTPNERSQVSADIRLSDTQMARVESIRSFGDMLNEDFDENVDRMADDPTFNIIEYFQFKLSKRRLRDDIENALFQLRRGFRTIPRDQLPFTMEEIVSRCNAKIRSLDDFRRFVDISELREKNEQLFIMFNSATEGMIPDELQAMLVYVTGGGFIPAKFHFIIRNDHILLPIVHSCFSQIELFINRYVDGFVAIRNGQSLVGVDLLRSDLISLSDYNGSSFDGSIDQPRDAHEYEPIPLLEFE